MFEDSKTFPIASCPILPNSGTSVESGKYDWVQDFVAELLVLGREGYVNSALATAVVHDLIDLSRRIRGL